MDRKTRLKKEAQKPGAPEWMNTYGDMVTLLLTFFVFLFAFSKVDEAKWVALVETFTGSPPSTVIEPIDPLNPVQGFKVEDYVPGIRVGAGYTESKGDQTGQNDSEFDSSSDTRSDGEKANSAAIEAEFSNLYDRIQSYIKENNLEGSLAAEREGEYIYLTMIEGTLFDSGQADLIDSAKLILKDIGNLLYATQDSIGNITVEGHTDNVPISTSQYVDNWDLSTKRATNVVRYVSTNCSLPMPMFTAVGKGEWDPVQTNDTEDGRRQNRRVKFIIERK